MDNPFVKLGKLMVETQSQNVEPFPLSVFPNPSSVEELAKRYDMRLDEQLFSFNKELAELETNIAELEQKNNILSILHDERFGKRVNNKTQRLNAEKIQRNETTITHLRSKQEQIIKAIEQTIMYKNKNQLKFQNLNPNPNP